ncbi:MAG: intracellular sulfur oxidation DsrE/DsrF family protein [Parasphingorhabdus sp.]|jgi:intracellular sulfur oxidation DsrE/DsrF family protein/tetrahydromethanopterin S-methyltransferase subunit B
MSQINDTVIDRQLLLHAYIDGELCNEEQREFRQLLLTNADLSRQAEELIRLKQQMCNAYKISPAQTVAANSPISIGSRRWAGIAASWIFGLLVGWMVVAPITNKSSSEIHIVTSLPTASDQTSSQPRVVVHVSRNDVESMQQALDNVELILEHYSSQSLAVRLQVIANGPGISMLQAESSPVANRIARLDQKYASLQFVACQNTIDLVRQTSGKNIQLLPEVLRVDSGVAELARKRASGWFYLGV